MNVQGRDCALLILLGTRSRSVAYREETLRDRRTLIRRDALLDADSGTLVPGTPGATGCVVAPLGFSSAPCLLSLAAGSEAMPEWVSATRSLYRHRLALSYGRAGPRFDIVQDRVALRRRYRNLRRTGFELRGKRSQRLYLRLDLAGDSGGEPDETTPVPKPEAEEAFSFDQGRLTVEGEELGGWYGFSLSVTAEGSRAQAELRLHTTLRLESAARLEQPRLERVELTFTLQRSWYEAGRPGTFRVLMQDLLYRADGMTVDAADDVIGYRRYAVNGELCFDVYTSDGQRILP